MSRRDTSPDPPGGDIFLTSSPRRHLQYISPGHGFLFHFRGRFSGSLSFAFFGSASLRLQAAGWRLPTMVLSETRGLAPLGREARSPTHRTHAIANARIVSFRTVSCSTRSVRT